ncbi:FAD-dependent oxidoreductase [Streptomyces sp. NPDC012825]|uniref:FAD-dependent oxidoreductase n=1 Tax=Streptomyces sp. NPDC012825 TaxID=3364851 RepID=UPI003675D9B6
MRVAIAGAGMAGLAAAWLLEESHDVLLLEERKTPGGNLRTFFPPDPVHVPEAVELGVRAVPSGPHSLVARLSGALGLDRGQWLPLPSGRLLLSDRGEADGSRCTASPFAPVRREEAVRAAALLAEQAHHWKNERLGWEVPLREMVEDFDLPRRVKEVAVYSLPAATFGCTLEQAGLLSARAVGELWAEDPAAPAPVSCRLRGGMHSLAQHLVSRSSRVQLALGTALRMVHRHGGKPELTDTNGRRYRVDALVLAVPADEAARILSPHFGPLRARLASYAYRPLLYQVHRDACHMPVDRDTWAPSTVTVHGPWAETTDWYPTKNGDLFVSQVTHRKPRPRTPLASAGFRTVQPTPGMLKAQRELLRSQGDGGIFLAGHVTTPVNTLENALGSAIAVARQLAPRSRRLAQLLDDT